MGHHCLFVSDLHGRVDRYEKLFDLIAHTPPEAVFLGGDLLPFGAASMQGAKLFEGDFTREFLIPGFRQIRDSLAGRAPRVFVIMGNDDVRSEEPAFLDADAAGVWQYMHRRRAPFDDLTVFGYAMVPPTPFQLKDWERYDVSRYIDPGSISPEEGRRTVPVPPREQRFRTIRDDLDDLAGDKDLSRSVFLFHAPPHNTKLDRVGLDGQMIDHVPLELHVGSIAMRRFIEKRSPLVTLHGHIHESTRLTGSFMDHLGKTVCLNAAHDGPELCVIEFDTACPQEAVRRLL